MKGKTAFSSKLILLVLIALVWGLTHSEITDINSEMHSLQENTEDALEGEDGKELDFDLEDIEDDIEIDKDSLQDTIDQVNQLIESGEVSEEEKKTLEEQVKEIEELI